MILSDKNQYWENCYICQSSNLKDFYKDKNIVICNDCKFVFYKKVPSAKNLQDVYSNYSREEYITIDSAKKIKKELISILERSKVSRVLDIACGECYTLDILRDIDPGLELLATEHESTKDNVISKGYTFVEGEFFPIVDKKVDLIIFTEAIEHINDVKSFLKHAYDLLNEGGIIYITTPNFSSIERIMMQSSWGMIKPPEHLSYFSPKTLNKVLSEKGFRKLSLKTENISIFRLIEYFNTHIFSKKNKKNKLKLSPQAASDKMQSLTNNNSFLSFSKKIINFLLNFFNLGSSIKAVYQKEG